MQLLLPVDYDILQLDDCIHYHHKQECGAHPMPLTKASNIYYTLPCLFIVYYSFQMRWAHVKYF